MLNRKELHAYSLLAKHIRAQALVQGTTDELEKTIALTESARYLAKYINYFQKIPPNEMRGAADALKYLEDLGAIKKIVFLVFRV
jgi:hypothetical protein